MVVIAAKACDTWQHLKLKEEKNKLRGCHEKKIIILINHDRPVPEGFPVIRDFKFTRIYTREAMAEASVI